MMKMDSFEWTELDRLTARLSELHSRREAAAKNRLDLVKGIEDEIRSVDTRRAQIVSHRLLLVPRGQPDWQLRRWDRARKPSQELEQT